jgi:hypothetical protein
MKKILAAAGLSAALFSVAPALALAAADTDTKNTTFNAMAEVGTPVELNDQELAAVEGQGGCGCEHSGTFMLQSQYGLANVGVQANDINVLSGNNVGSGNNIAILSLAQQASWLKTYQ